jgi:multiple sugar transport system permease protein
MKHDVLADIDLIERRVLGVFGARRTHVILFSTLALTLACLSLTPILLMFWGSFKLSGSLLMPQKQIPVLLPPPMWRQVPGSVNLATGMRLKRAGPNFTWDNHIAPSIVLETERNRLIDPASAPVWGVPGVFELHRADALIIHVRARWSQDPYPFALGFEDSDGNRVFQKEPTKLKAITYESTAGPAWKKFVIPLDQATLNRIDKNNGRRILLRPELPRVEIGRIDFQLRQYGFTNYTDIFRSGKFFRYTLNSLYVASCITLGNCFFCLLVGYVFARHSFRGKGLLWLTVLSSMMLPIQSLLVPIFMMMHHVPFFGGNDWLGQGGSGWLDTYWVLIVPWLVGPVGIFVMRQYVVQLPVELEESAEIDGAKTHQVLRHIVLPLSKPAMAAVAIITFLAQWNNFMFPYLLTRSDEMRTLPVGLALYQGQQVSNWGLIMAGSAIAALPVILVFLFFQRQLIVGLTHGALKG